MNELYATYLLTIEESFSESAEGFSQKITIPGNLWNHQIFCPGNALYQSNLKVVLQIQ